MTKSTNKVVGLAIEPPSEAESASLSVPASKSIGLEPTDPLAEAGRKVLAFHLARMLRHEPGTRSGTDIEALHDMRVATRRMRTAFRVFSQVFSIKAAKPWVRGLRATGRALGEVRDLDVFLEKLQQYRGTLVEPDQAGLAPLSTSWQFKRDEARTRLLAHLDSKAYLQFKTQFSEFVKTEGAGVKAVPGGVPVPYQTRHMVPGLVYMHYEAVRVYEVMLDNASWEMLHQLRIAFKQLRYTLEYFQEILGEESNLVIKEVKLAQDHLGELNDANVACSLLQELLANWDQNELHLPLAKRQNPAQIVTYLNIKVNERHNLTVSFPQVWARFNRPEFRRNLALAISAL